MRCTDKFVITNTLLTKKGKVLKITCICLIVKTASIKRFDIILQVIYPAGRERFPWHTSVLSCREYLEKNLFVTHVVLRELLFLWESQ